MHHRSFPIIIILAISLLTPPTSYSKPTSASQFLTLQNGARAALGLRPLVWDARLERYARRYAARRRRDCALVHSNGPYGENIFWGSGDGWTPAQAAAAWVSERSWYDYRDNSCAGGEECGHYTQIVWRSSRRVGCARVTCSRGKGVFMICNYHPPGNYVGERPYRSPKSTRIEYCWVLYF